MTLSPGHPLPRLSASVACRSRSCCAIAPAVRRDSRSSSCPRACRASSTLPDGGERVFVALEEVVRGNLDALYPADVDVEQATSFA